MNTPNRIKQPGELDVYEGRARRRCPECDLEIEVIRPTRAISKTSNRAWRKKSRQELARQLLWEAMCDDCRGFWNGVVRAVETVHPDNKAGSGAGAMSTQNTDDAIYEEAERWPYFSVSLK